MRNITYSSEGSLVNRHRGTMPIILTCPHDGTGVPRNVRERNSTDTPTTCTGLNEFNTGGDDQTARITESVAQKIFDLTCLSPYVVIAQFQRKYIDPNRRADCAFTDPAAARYYNEYHNRITEYVREVLNQNNNKGFLFDIHGTFRDSADIYLGTHNGRSLVSGVNRADLYMQHGLRGLLTLSGTPRLIPDRQPLSITRIFTSFGYRVFPPNATTDELGALNGGFTVRHYSSTMNINCVQLEISGAIRNDEQKRNFLTEDLAFALINFVRRYAPF